MQEDIGPSVFRLKIWVIGIITVLLLALLLVTLHGSSRASDASGGHEMLIDTIFLHFLAVMIGILILEGIFLGIDRHAAKKERERNNRSIAAEVAKLLSDGDNEAILQRFHGILATSPRLDFQELDALSHISKDLDILNTWMPNAAETLQLIETVIREGGKVRILLAHARSACVDARSLALGRDVSERIHISYKDLHELAGRLSERQQGDRIKIRLYKCLPPFSLYRLGDAIFVGFFGVSRAIDAFQLRIRFSSEIGTNVASQFDALWGRSLEVDVNQHPQQWGS